MAESIGRLYINCSIYFIIFSVNKYICNYTLLFIAEHNGRFQVHFDGFGKKCSNLSEIFRRYYMASREYGQKSRPVFMLILALGTKKGTDICCNNIF